MNPNRSKSQHWDQVYQSRANHQLGWFEESAQDTLKFLDDVSLSHQKCFIPGAGTSILVPALLDKGAHLTLNDISPHALSTLAQLYPQSQELPHQNLLEDLGSDLEAGSWFYGLAPQFHLWIDRAVLHFLISDKEVENYFKRLKNSLLIGAKVLLAEFTPGGAHQCASLPVRQYTTEDYQRALGDQFQLIQEAKQVYINPRGEERLYQYALFERINSTNS